MLHLPPELWVTILSQCDAPTLKAVRLSDKRLSNLAALFLYAKLGIGLFSHSLEKLQGISGHERLRYLVKEITFRDVYLVPYPSIEQYKRDACRIRPHSKRSGLLNTKDEWSSETYNFSQDEIKYHYGKYQQHLHDHESWRRNTDDLSFQECISKLDCLEVANFSYYYTSHSISLPILPSLRSETLVMEETSDWHPEQGDERGDRVLSLLLEGLSMRARRVQSTHASLQELNLRIDGKEFWRPEVSSNRIARMQPVFCNLQKLDCTIYGEHMKPEVVSADMAQLLGDAKHVRSLILRIDTNKTLRDSEISRDSLEFFPSSQMWPTLNDLTLSLHTTENSLLQVLINHSRSLKNLTLSRCRLIRGGGSWRSLIARLPEVLDLETVRLKQLYDDEFCGVRDGNGEKCLFASSYCPSRDIRSKSPRRPAFEKYILRGGPLPSFSRADFPHHKEVCSEPDEDSYDDDSQISYSNENDDSDPGSETEERDDADNDHGGDSDEI